MKKFLAGIALTAFLGGSAMAADIALKARPLPPPVFTWTGFYIGAHVGAGWGLKEEPMNIAGIIINQNNYAVTGFLGGGQVGFNYQVGPWVWGVEAQFSGANLDGNATCNVAVVALLNCHAKVDWLSTVAGRVGWAVDHALIYVKGGAAWAHDKYDIAFSIIPFTNIHVDNTRSGWMFGTGIEYALAGPWSAKIEYNYLDFGTKTTTFPGLFALIGAFENVAIRERIHLVKFGVNYRFGGFGKGVVAAY